MRSMFPSLMSKHFSFINFFASHCEIDNVLALLVSLTRCKDKGVRFAYMLFSSRFHSRDYTGYVFC